MKMASLSKLLVFYDRFEQIEQLLFECNN